MGNVTDTIVPTIAPPAAQTDRGFRLFVLSAMLSIVGSAVFSGDVPTLTALNLGEEERYIGLLNFLLFGSSMAQIFATVLAQRMPKNRFLIVTFFVIWLCTLPAICIP